MLALLGSLLGFAGSAIPEVINSFKEDGKHKHALEMMKLQLEASKNSVKLEKDVYDFKALDEEQDEDASRRLECCRRSIPNLGLPRMDGNGRTNGQRHNKI